MRQVIPFTKDIILKTRIAEMTSISVEHNLKLDSDYISGELILTGDYKMTEASINKEEFEYKIPFEIELTNRYKTDTFNVEIEDFYYEIINNDILRINVELLVLGEEEQESFENYYSDTNDDDIREVKNEEILDEVIKEELEEELGELEETDDKIRTLFDSLDDSLDNFSSYNVHIMRENDTLESIMLKYKVTKEELKDYNDIDNIIIGTKIIIPVIKLDE